MKFKVMLDEERFTEKPSDRQTGGIVERISQKPVELTAYELAISIHQGMSVVPAYLGKKNKSGRIRKSKECWTSQQLVFLDFDNTKYIPDPKPDMPNNKKKVKDIQLTIEQAKDTFKDDAMFIYKTFTHKDDWPKFRVVIALDRTIHNEMIMDKLFNRFQELYPCIDSQCLEYSHLFYGGKEIIQLNYDNRLNVDWFLSINDTEGGKKGVHNNLSLSNNVPPFSPTCEPDRNNFINKNSNIESIMNRDAKRLSSLINARPVSVSRLGLYDYLYSIDFSVLLNVDHKHCCLYHNDTKPSATISINPKKGQYVYRCFSCGWEGNIITCIEKLFEDRNIKIRKSMVIEMLRTIYRIDIELDEWGKQQKSELESNIDLLLSGEIEEFEPNLHKLIVRNIPNLISLHILAIQNIISEEFTDQDGNVLMFKDVRGITAAMGKGSPDKIAKDINFYTYLGVMNKVEQKHIPKSILTQISKYQFDMQHRYKKNCYSFPSYTNKVRKYADQKALEWGEKGYVKKHLSREMLIRGHGEDEANRVYPQMVGESISEFNQETAQELVKLGMEYIEQKGWTTEKEIEDGLRLYWKGQKKYKEGMMKTIRSEFYDSYGLIRTRLNNTLAEKLNIVIERNPKGNCLYPNIIYKKDDVIG